MERRKWEDLPIDCLVQIFGKVGLETLLLDIPFVCKSWYKATLDPQCWQILYFPEIKVEPQHRKHRVDNSFVSRLMNEYGVEGCFSIIALVKTVVNRSGQLVTRLTLPSCCTYDVFAYVADKCHALKVLVLHGSLPHDLSSKFVDLISEWKNLELLAIGGSTLFLSQILAQVGMYCENFEALGLAGAFIDEDEAMAIVTSLPNLKYLFIPGAHIGRQSLLMILKSCRELLRLDANECIGFEETDDEILNLASHIETFQVQGSKMYDGCDLCTLKLFVHT